MRCLVLADVHASLAALEAVLADAGAVDEVWCLGDLVDLGPAPEACVERLRELGARCVRGNHDLGDGPEVRRVPLVGESLGWTRRQLSPSSRAFLEGLPERVEVDGLTLRHDVAEGGHTRAPRPADFAKVGRGGMLVGHFHLPFVLREGEAEGRVVDVGQRLGVAGAIVNPGPVGVSDWRPGWAAYGLLDTARGEVEVRGLEVPAAPDEAEIASIDDAPPRLVAYWRRLAADAARARGELDRAGALFRLSAPAFDEPGDERQATMLLIGLADLARHAGDPARAARLLGGVGGPAARHPVARHRVAELRGALGSTPAGPEIGLDEAIALGLEATP
jgi:predicted phosphodiesterase